LRGSGGEDATRWPLRIIDVAALRLFPAAARTYAGYSRCPASAARAGLRRFPQHPQRPRRANGGEARCGYAATRVVPTAPHAPRAKPCPCSKLRRCGFFPGCPETYVSWSEVNLTNIVPIRLKRVPVSVPVRPSPAIGRTRKQTVSERSRSALNRGSTSPMRGDPDAKGNHWITSSARSSTDCWIVRPSALAVFRLMTNSNLVGRSIGKSPGAAPFRILTT